MTLGLGGSHIKVRRSEGLGKLEEKDPKSADASCPLSDAAQLLPYPWKANHEAIPSASWETHLPITPYYVDLQPPGHLQHLSYSEREKWDHQH